MDNRVQEPGIFDSMPKLLGGLAFGVLAFAALWKVEGDVIAKSRALAEGGQVVISVDARELDPANDGKLVRVAGLPETSDRLQDDQFELSINALGLMRKVEMYQWQEYTETQTTTAGSTRNISYRYRQQWDTSLLDHRDFRYPEGHENPPVMPPFEWVIGYAENVSLGMYQLSPAQIKEVGEWKNLPSGIAPDFPSNETVPLRTEEGFYLGDDPTNPQVGDVRIHFTYLEPVESTIIAQQAGTRLLPYTAESGDTIELVEHGIGAAADLIESAGQEDLEKTWLFRALGFVCMLIGVLMTLQTLTAIASNVRWIGSIANGGVNTIGFLLAVSLSLGTVAAAWAEYQPKLAAGLLGAAVMGCVLLFARIKAGGKKAA